MRPVLLEMPISSTPRQRDWMFSSAVSGGRPGELVLERGQRRLEHALDGDLAVLDARARRACSAASSRLICEV